MNSIGKSNVLPCYYKNLLSLAKQYRQQILHSDKQHFKINKRTEFRKPPTVTKNNKDLVFIKHRSKKYIEA